MVAYSFSLSISAYALEQGKDLYDANCAGCHGAGGQGDGPEAASLSKPPTDFTDQALMAERTSENFYQAVTKGLPPDMPSFNAQLSEEERWALADYLRMLTFVPPASRLRRRPSSPPRLPRSPRRPRLEGTGCSACFCPGRSQTWHVSGTAPPVARPRRVRPRPVVRPWPPLPGRHDPRVGEQWLGGDVPKDLVVTLHGFDEMQSVITGTATSGGWFVHL